jgi:hypothetical protein
VVGGGVVGGGVVVLGAGDGHGHRLRWCRSHGRR